MPCKMEPAPPQAGACFVDLSILPDGRFLLATSARQVRQGSTGVVGYKGLALERHGWCRAVPGNAAPGGPLADARQGCFPPDYAFWEAGVGTHSTLYWL